MTLHSLQHVEAEHGRRERRRMLQAIALKVKEPHHLADAWNVTSRRGGVGGGGGAGGDQQTFVTAPAFLGHYLLFPIHFRFEGHHARVHFYL